ncbi:MAG: ATP-binding protein, partial [bacterium]
MNTQERYEKFRKLGMHRTVTQICAVVVVFITAMLLYDFLVNKNRGLTFIYLPVGLIVITMVIASINNLQRFTLNPYYLSLFIIITVVPGISLMDYFNPFMLSSSLPTIIIMILFWGVLLPLTFPESIVLFLLAWISYVSSFIIHINDYNMTTISNNTIFIFISCILAALWSINNYKQRKKVWILQQSGASEKPELCYQNTEKRQHQESQVSQAERAAFINQVISSLVHDLNNFLTIILGKNHLIYDSLPEGDKNRNHIETVTKTCEKASALIRKLLAVSNNQICMPDKINLNETINEVKDMVTHTISRNIDLIIKKDPRLHPVKVDPLELEQILLNLCINARDAMPNGGKLILETRNVSLDEIYCTSRNLSLEPGEYVMIAIGDTGTGISKKIRSQIFKPFFTTKDKDSGTGLGLSSV